MRTYYIHIDGMVQGVGFRPCVCRIAERMGMNGWVSNSTDGLHIVCTDTPEKAELFYNTILQEPPANAVIRSHQLFETGLQEFNGFTIRESDASAKPNLLITPDIALCPQCRAELNNADDQRFQYAFTTCLECGPRYSIMTALPYDRENTTMAELAMCDHCSEEYNDIHNRRHYSQTNSCPDCSIPMHLFNNAGDELSKDPEHILIMVEEELKQGHIVAVKGLGGYLLIGDATNQLTIETLRDRKKRPSKPFAVMYPDMDSAKQDVNISEKEAAALSSKAAPIVLCRLNEKTGTGLCQDLIAPGLDKIGVMLPYTPLLLLIAQNRAKPLIATSGNLSGSPIIYTDEDAMLWLGEQADVTLAFDRDIVTPQDDSVMQIAPVSGQPIIIRRSRGLAPNYFPAPFQSDETILAMGAELKSAFALLDDRNLYISQFLGDQENYESQTSYTATLQHLLNLVQVMPKEILIDKHPNYFVSGSGKELAAAWEIPCTEIQHHVAHFGAVLGENDLLQEKEPVLGVIWDGTGFGDDGHIWGGEFFLLNNGEIDRYMHLDYFPQLLGDKMSREPRVSAVALLRNDMDKLMMIKDQFLGAEREFYMKVLAQPQNLLTSSMGRFLDGIASMLNIQTKNHYEGEAAMKLEAAARQCEEGHHDHYPLPFNQNRIDWTPMLHELLQERNAGRPVPSIARKVFNSLARLIGQVALKAGVRKIAISGGVFQNALLVDLVHEWLGADHELYFHRQLSPNDECIGFGQLACHQLEQYRKAYSGKQTAAVTEP